MKYKWFGVLAVVLFLIIGVFAFVSAAKAKVTGNFVKALPSKAKNAIEIYTKQEIDDFLATINSRLDALEGGKETCTGKCISARQLFKVTQIVNGSGGFSGDKVTLVDYATGDTYEATLTSEGEGTITIEGQVYVVKYFGSAEIPEHYRYIELGQNLNVPNPISVRAFRGTYFKWPI